MAHRGFELRRASSGRPALDHDAEVAPHDALELYVTKFARERRARPSTPLRPVEAPPARVQHAEVAQRVALEPAIARLARDHQCLASQGLASSMRPSSHMQFAEVAEQLPCMFRSPASRANASACS